MRILRASHFSILSINKLYLHHTMIPRNGAPTGSTKLVSLFYSIFAPPCCAPCLCIVAIPYYTRGETPTGPKHPTRAPARARGLSPADAPGEKDREFYDGIIVGHTYPGIKTQSGSRGAQP
jgi:hypothetical protein